MDPRRDLLRGPVSVGDRYASLGATLGSLFASRAHEPASTAAKIDRALLWVRLVALAYLAPEVLKRLTCGREGSAVSLYDLCFLAGEAWEEQVGRSLEFGR